MRSILDLDIAELEEVLNTNSLPDGVGLQGIEERADFAKLFKHRVNPKHIASALLKEKLKTRVLTESPELKSERLAIKQVELELRRKRIEAVTAQQTNIYKRLQAIEDACGLIVRGISNINEKLDVLIQRGDCSAEPEQLELFKEVG